MNNKTDKPASTVLTLEKNNGLNFNELRRLAETRIGKKLNKRDFRTFAAEMVTNLIPNILYRKDSDSLMILINPKNNRSQIFGDIAIGELTSDQLVSEIKKGNEEIMSFILMCYIEIIINKIQEGYIFASGTLTRGSTVNPIRFSETTFSVIEILKTSERTPYMN